MRLRRTTGDRPTGLLRDSEPALAAVGPYRAWRQRPGTVAALGALALGCMVHDAAAQEPVRIAAGVPLQVAVTHTAAMRVGARVDGVLTAPVWVYDRLVLPAGVRVEGVVVALEPVAPEERLRARLNGDVTPLHAAVVNFNMVQLGSRAVPLDSEGRMRQIQIVRFVARPKTSVFGQLVGFGKERFGSTRTELTAPGKRDRLLRLVYGQLPYHPQRIWRGADFVADLVRPASVEMAEEKAAARIEDAALVGSLPAQASVKARLVSSVDSDHAAKGDVVTAVVTEPVFLAGAGAGAGGAKRLVLPEGTALQGTVTGVKASRSFGRNGQLRFAFRTVERPDEPAQKVYGTLTGASGSAEQNLVVDAEGNVKAQPDKGRFAAPLLLAALAAGGHDDDGGLGRQVVAANGLGLVARVLALTLNNRNVASGFGAYGFAKSVYFRFIERGHPVTFPKDTLVEVQLSGR